MKHLIGIISFLILAACARPYVPIPLAGNGGSNPPTATPPPQNTLTIFSLTDVEDCIDIGDSLSAKKPSEHSSSVKVYYSGDCTGSFISMSNSSNQIHLVDENLLLVVEGTNNSGLFLKKLTF